MDRFHSGIGLSCSDIRSGRDRRSEWLGDVVQFRPDVPAPDIDDHPARAGQALQGIGQRLARAPGTSHRFIRSRRNPPTSCSPPGPDCRTSRIVRRPVVKSATEERAVRPSRKQIGIVQVGIHQRGRPTLAAKRHGEMCADVDAPTAGWAPTTSNDSPRRPFDGRAGLHAPVGAMLRPGPPSRFLLLGTRAEPDELKSTTPAMPVRAGPEPA